MSEKNARDIGALWLKMGNKGEYLSGYVEVNGVKVDLVCFKNGYKKSDKHPEWKILLSQPKNQSERNIEAEEANQEGRSNYGAVENPEINVEDIPF